MSDALAHIESKYEVLGKIKEGGMGAIYLVRHRLLGETRVIKVLRPQLDSQAEFHTRFLREARTAIQLRHPNIAQLYDFTSDEAGNAYIVMEYIEGLDLRELLRRSGPPPLSLTLEIAAQSLAALGFLHRRSMVHRDISPDNLMLARDADGKPLVKLVDLGIVKDLQSDQSELTSTGVFIGKVRYAAPEQFRTNEGAALDQRADLYAFGAVLYEMLTGRLPIAGESASQLIAGHLYSPPVAFDVSDPDKRVPEALRAIVLKLLEKQPERRFDTAEALTEALGPLQAEHRWAAGDVEACFAGFKPALQAVAVSPGTQEHLNRQFAGRTTPPPHGVPGVAATLPADPGATAPTRPMVPGAPASDQAVEGATAPTVPMVPTAPGAAAVPVPPPAPAAARSTLPFVLAGAALLVVLLAAGTWLLKDRLGLGGARAADVAAGARATGLLVIHAVPWAEVVSVTDSAGAALPLPVKASTPLALPLPPGTYKVAVRAPESDAVTTMTAEVRAGETARCLAAVGKVDTEAFLAGMGW
jgi:eukaryotic-like serine/threonine-protein kinase